MFAFKCYNIYTRLNVHICINLYINIRIRLCININSNINLQRKTY